MSNFFGPDHLTGAAFRMRSKRPRPEQIGIGRGHVVKRNLSNNVPFKDQHRAELGPAGSRRILQQALEHRLQIAGRAADDPKHL
jgi:hypothetical protein